MKCPGEIAPTCLPSAVIGRAAVRRRDAGPARASGPARAVLAFAVVVTLGACRGGDGPEELPGFPEASDPDAFGLFLNASPGVPASGMPRASVDNVADFPEAYYNTIDPDGTRTNYRDWQRANGFLTADGQPAPCVAPDCEQVRARFRDTKDLGYGRDMTMRRDRVTGDVAVYVENYNVSAIEGLPYGPLNAEALAAEDRRWNFGVNAIEFSAFPYTEPGAPQFAKFYNFAGDGERAIDPSGTLQHVVDLDERGFKAMPTPCIVCHGGEGRTLVVRGTDDVLRLAPTIPGRPAGDVLANLQMLELDTLQFVDQAGLRREDNAAAIAAINDAVLATWRVRDAQRTTPNGGDWDPALAIELLENRYPERVGTGDDTRLTGVFDGTYVPGGEGGWASEAPELYRDIVGPNCMVCHAMRGKGLNPALNFATAARFAAYAERSDHLVFDRGVMPLGLLNYANLWDDPTKDTGGLATLLGHAERVGADGRAPAPGRPVARIAAPTPVAGLDASGAPHDIPLSGRDSAFTDADTFDWSVSPAGTATIVDEGVPGMATLRVTAPGDYAVTLETGGSERDERSSDTLTVTVVADDAIATPPPAEATFHGENGVFERILAPVEAPGTGCVLCHADNGLFDGIPIHYERCRGDGGDDDFLYRSVLARVNFARPLDSLIFRKPTNGATDLADLEGTQSRNVESADQYHAGGYSIGSDEDAAHLLAWILNGAPRGAPSSALPADAPACPDRAR